MIAFAELLGNYVRIIIWGPVRSCNKDLIWIEIPIVADNHANGYIDLYYFATHFSDDAGISGPLHDHQFNRNVKTLES